MKKTLIFLDIDGTLLKPNYRTNSAVTTKYIRKLSKLNFLFCLNSNRAIEDMEPIIKKFKINGPVIGENGVFYKYKGEIHKLIQAKKIQNDLAKTLGKLSLRKKVYLEIADTVNYKWSKLNNSKLSWIVNKNRQWTASIHVLKNGKRYPKGADDLKSILIKHFGKKYSVTTSPIFANVLVSPKEINKGVALKLLKEKFPESMFYMIGDDSADLSAKQYVDKFFAVGNAEKKLKKCAFYIAKKKYTQGVVEILRKIATDL